MYNGVCVKSLIDTAIGQCETCVLKHKVLSHLYFVVAIHVEVTRCEEVVACLRLDDVTAAAPAGHHLPPQTRRVWLKYVMRMVNVAHTTFV